MSASADASMLFAACRGRVDRLLDADASSEELEHTIATFPLDCDAKAALWLWASSQRPAARDGGHDRPLPAWEQECTQTGWWA